MKKINEKGSVLIIAYSAIIVILIFAGIFFGRVINQKHLSDIDNERLQAMHLAEAGIDRAISELRSDYNGYTGTQATDLGRGQYETTVSTVSSISKSIISYGYVPSKAQALAQYGVEVITKKLTPLNFYDYVIYASNNLTFTGVTYSVTGKAVYGGVGDNVGFISGGATQDSTVNPLARFDFAVLRDISISQGNYYDEARLKSGEPFPMDFWYEQPYDPSDPSTGVPNVVYVEGAMTLTGNDVVGGFFLVVGNILTDPAVIVDTTIKGDITVNGCIYTTGNFTAKGGGNAMNITGGIWAGGDALLNGNIKMTYDSDYMVSIKNLVDSFGASGAIQVLSWRKL